MKIKNGTYTAQIIIKSLYVALTIVLVLLHCPAMGEENPAKWQFEFTPYLWNAGVGGSTSADGEDAEIDKDYSFFSLSNLESVFSAAFEAKKDPWGWSVDGLYVEYSDDFEKKLTSKVTVELGFIQGSVDYRLNDFYGISILAGMRHVFINTAIDISTGAGAGEDTSWLDPIIGVYYIYDFHPRWYARFYLDMGSFGVSSDFSFNTQATVGFKATDMFSLKLGYRYMSMDFKEDDFLYDVSMQGLFFGVGICF